MRYIIALLALLFAPPAAADTYRPLTSYSLDAAVYPGTVSSVTLGHATGGQTRAVRVVCTVACFVAFPVTSGTTAAAQDATEPVFLPANREDYFKVTSGHFVFVGVDSSTGTLYVTEVE